MIDVTPMIDVVFQLVLFFMVTTTFITNPGIEVDLPRSTAQVVLSTENDVQVWMTVDGAVFIDDEAVTSKQMVEIFRKRAKADPNSQVVIKADTGVAHGRVVAVMDIARSEGLSRLAIATDVEE